MITWLKGLALGGLIRSLDQLEAPFAEKIKEAQAKANSIPPEQFAKEVVDMLQVKLCALLKLDPKKILALVILGMAILWPIKPAMAMADEAPFYVKGPLSLNIPFKAARVTYLYDFNAHQSLVGGETPILTLWNRIEGTFGAVTSLDGQGTPFVGGNVILGNVLERYIALPPDLLIGGYGGYNFQSTKSIYGFKTSLRIW